jgi:adenine deaminase
MHILVREGSVSKDLAALMPIITERNSPFIALCTDDRNPLDIADHGHLDHMIRTAIAAGVEPLAIYRAASISAARAFGLKDRGLVAPGWRADLVVLDTLADCRAETVLSAGRIVSDALFAKRKPVAPVGRHSVKARRVAAADFRAASNSGRTRAIGIIPGKIITESREFDLAVGNHGVEVDLDRDVVKIAVVERHGKNGNIATGFVHGFGLKHGAIASTVSHDSHNICVVGTSDEDIAVAANRLGEIEGGFVVVRDGKVLAELALPIAGLMSLAGYETVRDELRVLRKAAYDLGSTLEEPFLQLAFIALPVIPHLKITDKGMVDVDRFQIIGT